MAQSQAFQTAKTALQKFGEMFDSRLKGGEASALPTGIRELDALGGGMRPGELWIVCGETSAGKSALAYQMTIPAIEEGKKVLIMTLEMTSDEVVARLMSCRGRIDLGCLTNPQGGGFNGDVKRRSRLQTAMLAESQLKISDEPNMTIDFVCAQAEMEAELGGVDLVIVDYLQLLDGGRKAGDSQEQELAYYSRRLKQLAKKLNCPVISPAQINDDGRLRGSRAIGHDADVILKIEPNEGVLVGKYRNGEKGGTLPLGLIGHHQRFDTMDFKPRNQYGR
jgi:replicative DNA helicase